MAPCVIFMFLGAADFYIYTVSEFYQIICAS